MIAVNGCVFGPGLRAPARLFFLGAALLLMPLPLLAQAPRAQAPPAQRVQQPAPRAPATAPLPDQIGSTKLVMSAIIAIDQANRTGNYSVLLGLGSAGFQANNSAASLGAVFGVFRTRQIDLSDVLIRSPTFSLAPTLIQPTLLRMRGGYSLGNGPLGFDLIFAWDNGWRLQGVSLTPPPPR